MSAPVRTETRHTIILIAGTGATAVLSLLYAAYAGRVIGLAEYADFATAVALVMMCQIALGPINGTVARFTAEYSGRGETGKIQALSRAVTRRVALYGLLGVVIALLAVKPLAALLQFTSVLPLVVAYGMIYLMLLVSVPRGVLRGVQSFGHHSVNTVLEASLRFGMGVLLLAFVRVAVTGLSAYVVALVAVLIVSRFQLRHLWAGVEPQPVDGAAVRRFAVPMFVMMLASGGFAHLDMFFVKHYFGATDAGVYGAAFTLARAMSVLVTPFTTLLLPALTALHARRQRTAGTFLRICGYFLLLALVPLAAFRLWPERIMVLLYGTEFSAAAVLLVPLTVARLLGLLCHMLALAGAAANRFGFLTVYVPALAAQALALVVWHESLSMVVTAVLAVQAVTLVAMATFAIVAAPGTPSLLQGDGMKQRSQP